MSNWIPDTYERRTRIAPALLVSLAPALSLLAVLPELPSLWQGAPGLIAASGGAYALMHFVRQWGKSRERDLYEAWGGTPTTQLLRHRGPAPRVEVEHRHRQINRLYPGLPLPTAEKEAEDPEGADRVYETAVKLLRDATRDQKRFALLFKENCAYGFCRNAFGLRRIGIALAVAAASVMVGALIGAYLAEAPFPPAVFPVLALDVVAALIWVGLVTPDWVRVAAFAYAERLLGAADHLP